MRIIFSFLYVIKIAICTLKYFTLTATLLANGDYEISVKKGMKEYGEKKTFTGKVKLGAGLRSFRLNHINGDLKIRAAIGDELVKNISEIINLTIL